MEPVTVKYLKQIKARPSDIIMHWRINGSPKARIVSNNALPLGLDHIEASLQQAIVRIKSEQVLDVQGVGKEFREVQSKPKQSHMVEYMVLQRLIVEGRPRSWKVWGFTELATMATIEQGEEFARTMVEYQTSQGPR